MELRLIPLFPTTELTLTILGNHGWQPKACMHRCLRDGEVSYHSLFQLTTKQKKSHSTYGWNIARPTSSGKQQNHNWPYLPSGDNMKIPTISWGSSSFRCTQGWVITYKTTTAGYISYMIPSCTASTQPPSRTLCSLLIGSATAAQQFQSIPSKH